MTNNVNKVIFGNDTLIDLTSDTVTPDSLLEGYTAHSKDGSIIRGTLVKGASINDDAQSQTTTYSSTKIEEIKSELQSSINSKVSTSTYNSKITELQSSINSKVSTSTYNSYIKKNHIEAGYFSLSVSSGGKAEGKTRFSASYVRTPSIQVTVESAWADAINATIYGSSKSGFTTVVHNSAAASTNVTVHWIAFGEIR